MCGRFSFVIEDALIRERFGVRVQTAIYKARYNCAPAQELAVITSEAPDELRFFRWGLIPSWAKEPSIGHRMINARAETLQEKPSFRNIYRSKRCLVPATGFYEWRKAGGKTPYNIRLRGGKAFCFAGLWDRWHSPEGSVIQSFTIITTEPNELIKPIHDRMPVIMEQMEEQRWLTEKDPSALTTLLRPYPAGEMEAYPVSSLVNSPRNDSPELTEPCNLF